MKRRMFWFVTIVLTVWLTGMTVLLADAQELSSSVADIELADNSGQVVLNGITPAKAIRLFVDTSVKSRESSLIRVHGNINEEPIYSVLYDTKEYTLWHDGELLLQSTKVSDVRKHLYNYMKQLYADTGKLW